jgi:hypothetical protein
MKPKVRAVLEHYEGQTEDGAVAEDEAAFHLSGQTVMVVPKRLVPKITRLIQGERSTRPSRIGLAHSRGLRFSSRKQEPAGDGGCD